jgi:hypothetical protein
MFARGRDVATRSDRQPQRRTTRLLGGIHARAGSNVQRHVDFAGEEMLCARER